MFFSATDERLVGTVATQVLLEKSC